MVSSRAFGGDAMRGPNRTMKSNWIVRYAPRVHPRARLFCFPYAGAGGSVYRLWSQGLPESFDVCAVQPPGREGRLRETPISNMAELVEALLPHLVPELDLPFAFFGHSMGAVLATEVARALEARGGPLPRHLVVSARRPPHLPGTESPLHPLGDQAFLEEVQRRYGGIPPEVMQDREVIALLLPCLRADIAALETHRPSRRPALPFPISAFGGTDDALTPREHLDAWRDETAATFRVRTFPGGHFYLTARRAEVLADLAATLAPFAHIDHPGSGPIA
ncbi:MAG TPA: alpha/beta fold hydrolase [Polyangiaceae bacterium]|nr:alpha/beta fold hydrolase [Polyangiaceae bacterium]